MGLNVTKETSTPFNDLQVSKETSSTSLNDLQISNENNENSFPNTTNLSTPILINELLNEAEHKMNSHEYTEYVEILQLTTILGSSYSAAKLGYINLRGLYETVEPDYASSAAYFFIALKFIKMTPSTKWDTNLVLKVIEGLTEIYRCHFNHQRDLLIWNHGIEMMKFIDVTLNDPFFLKTSTNKKEFQMRKALRIHITFCLALTSEVESKNTSDYKKVVDLYHECEQIGKCGLNAADKLVKKAHTKFRLLEPRVPRVQPICVTCNFEAKDLKTIWNLLVCSKCQVVACCNRKCLKNHLSSHKN